MQSVRTDMENGWLNRLTTRIPQVQKLSYHIARFILKGRKNQPTFLYFGQLNSGAMSVDDLFWQDAESLTTRIRFFKVNESKVSLTNMKQETMKAFIFTQETHEVILLRVGKSKARNLSQTMYKKVGYGVISCNITYKLMDLTIDCLFRLSKATTSM